MRDVSLSLQLCFISFFRKPQVHYIIDSSSLRILSNCISQLQISLSRVLLACLPLHAETRAAVRSAAGDATARSGLEVRGSCRQRRQRKDTCRLSKSARLVPESRTLASLRWPPQEGPERVARSYAGRIGCAVLGGDARRSGRLLVEQQSQCAARVLLLLCARRGAEDLEHGEHREQQQRALVHLDVRQRAAFAHLHCEQQLRGPARTCRVGPERTRRRAGGRRARRARHSRAARLWNAFRQRQRDRQLESRRGYNAALLRAICSHSESRAATGLRARRTEFADHCVQLACRALAHPNTSRSRRRQVREEAP